MGLGILASWGTPWLLPLALTGASADVPVAAGAPAQAEVPFSDIQFQVETRQRVIIRITPLSRVAPPPTVSLAPVETQRRRPDRDGERCLPLAQVAGVRLGQGRQLLLHMRDRRVFGTTLDRTCQVSSFYSGFYVERPEDGMLCAGREALHARSGADCVMGTFHEIDATQDDD